MSIPTITTSNLRLRPFAAGDLPALFEILQEPGIFQYFPNPGNPTRNQVRRFIERQIHGWEDFGYAWWAVEPYEENCLAGWCGLQFLPESDETEIGYLLGERFRGKGYATEAAQRSVRWGFETLPLERLIALVHPQNTASRRVIEKVGMTYLHEAEYFGMLCRKYQLARGDHLFNTRRENDDRDRREAQRS